MSAPARRQSSSGRYSRPFRQSRSRSCQKLVSCSAVQTASERASSAVVPIAGDPQHEPADRVRRAPAVVQHVVPGLVARRGHVLAERAQQVVEQRHREAAGADCSAERGEDVRRWLAGRARAAVSWRPRRPLERTRRGGPARRRAAPGAPRPAARLRRRSRRPRARRRRRRRRAAASRAAAARTRRGSSRSGRARTGRRWRRPRRGRSPFELGHARAVVHGPCRDEQEVGQAVDVGQQLAPAPRPAPSSDDPALGAAADGARQVERRAGRRAAGQDEPPERRQLRLEPVDPLLEPPTSAAPTTIFSTRAGDLLRRGRRGARRRRTGRAAMARSIVGDVRRRGRSASATPMAAFSSSTSP